MKLGNYPYKSELRLEFEAIGEARAILDHHGVVLGEEERRLISSCGDLQRLDTWFDLALAGASACSPARLWPTRSLPSAS
jgi:hypothetical protein